jgi:lactoylglutathione lyase
MKLEHVAIWTRQLENLRAFYITYFNGVSNEKYINSAKGFESYFISFASGARLELMSRADIPENQNDRAGSQHLGLIHLSFEVGSMTEVDQKAEAFRALGFPILSGPLKTGDGYYEFETLDPDGNRLEVSALFI